MIWSWVLSSIGIFGLYLVSNKKMWGWKVNIVAQVVWFVYAISTKQYGFIPACAAYGWVYYRNLKRAGVQA